MNMKGSASPFQLALAGLLLLAVPAACRAAERWSVDDLIAFESVADLAVSPVDPRVVVWVKSAPDKEKNELVLHLFRGGPENGTQSVQLTRGKDSCSHPRFSPDGRMIAFLSARPVPKAKGKEGAPDEE